jgi:DNA-binding IclR family transcriptional regulator
MEAPNTIPVVQQTMRVIAAIAEGRGRGVSISALVKQLNITNATGYRIVQTLLGEGWIEQLPGGGFELGRGMLPLLTPLMSRRQLLDAARPIIERLAGATGHSCKLVVRQADHAVTALRADSPASRMAVTSPVGSQFNLCYGAGGAALLVETDRAHLDRIIAAAPKDVWKHQTPQALRRRIEEIRKHGWTSDIGGFHPSVGAIGAPVPGVPAAIVIMGWPDDFTPRRVGALARDLLGAARELSHCLALPEARPS